MNKNFYPVSFFFCSLLICMYFNNVVGLQYRAGVYAHHTVQPNKTTVKVNREESLQNMMKNLEIYSKVATDAHNQGVEILVYPEDGIYGFDYTRIGIQSYLEYIPDPRKVVWNPCNDPNKYSNTEVQRHLSCMALNNSLYIVANMGDIQACDIKVDPKCPKDGHYQFNTNVVYNPNGTLIARYHKTHLYYEDQFDPSPQAEPVYFDTTFGRFGVFICFDLLFRHPAIDLIEQYNVTNVVFPAAWNDMPPLLSAIQFHSAFARGMGVNLLAANTQLNEYDFHGSGIYSPYGYLKFYLNEQTNEPKLVVADVTSKNNIKQPQKINILSTITNSNTRQASPIFANKRRTFTNVIKQKYTRDKTQLVNILSTMFPPKISHSSTQRLNKKSKEVGSAPKKSQNALLSSKSNFPTTVANNTFRLGIFNDSYTLRILDNSGDVIKVCDNNLCCELDYQMMEGSDNIVAFGVFDGIHTYLTTLYLQVCMLFECAGSDQESCSLPTEKSNLYFREFRITGNFSTKYIFPEVLVSDSGVKTLASGELYDYHEGTLEVINGLRLPLISAALVSRDYEKD